MPELPPILTADSITRVGPEAAGAVVVNDLSWSFLFAPVGVGALLLALFAFCWHNLVARGAGRADTWPTHWW